MLIGNAWAQTGGGGGADLLGMLPILLMFVVLYFLMIRPQMKRAKEHKSMFETLKKGDEVVTGGGVVGKITKVGESYVSLEVARSGEEFVELHFQKGASQTLLPNGTIKQL